MTNLAPTIVSSRLEELLRGLLAGVLIAVVVTALATAPAREPAPSIQLVQLAHGVLGLVVLPIALLYVLVHLVQVFGSNLRTSTKIAWLVVLVSAVVVFLIIRGGRDMTGDERDASNRHQQWIAMAAFAGLVIATIANLRKGINVGTRSGLLLLLFWSVTTVTGILTVGGLAAHGLWFHHVWTAAVVIALGAIHTTRSLRARGLEPPPDARRFAWRAPMRRIAIPTAVVTLTATAVIVWRLQRTLEPLRPDTIALVGVARGFDDVVPTACEGCHVSTTATWRLSAHAHAASSPVFTALVRRLAEARGGHAVAECLACHAPHAADPAAVPIEEVIASSGYRAGIQCVTCHRMVEDRSTAGLPLAIQPMDADRFHFLHELGGPVATAIRGNPPLMSVLVAARVDAHRRGFRATLAAPASCRPCHHQSLGAATDGRRHETIQDQYGGWRGSPMGQIDTTCTGCHMRTFYAAEGYYERDHRFLGASTYVARIAGGADAERVIVDHLQGGYALPANAKSEGYSDTDVVPLVSISARLETVADTRVLRFSSRGTEAVGHAFAEGPTDLTQTWLAVRVVDSSDRVVLERGHEGPDEELRIGLRLFDGAGERILDHRLYAVERLEDRGRIPVDGTRVDLVPLPRTELAEPLRVEAWWNYRRLDPALVRELTGEEPEGLPIVRIAQLTGVIRDGAFERDSR